MLIFSHTPRLEAVITIRELPRELAQMSDGSLPVPDIWVGVDRFLPSTQGISQLPSGLPAECLPDIVGIQEDFHGNYVRKC